MLGEHGMRKKVKDLTLMAALLMLFCVPMLEF